MRRNKKIYALAMAASSIGLGAFGARHASAAATYDFNIAANAGTWVAYALDTATTNDAGLDAFGIDINGTGGVTAVTGALMAPESGSNGFGGTTNVGSASGTTWQNLQMSQNTATNAAGCVVGVGEEASSASNLNNGMTWTYNASLGTPIASGTYTGGGTLTLYKAVSHTLDLVGSLNAWSSPSTGTATAIYGSVLAPPPSSSQAIISLTASAPATYGTTLANGTGANLATFHNSPSTSMLKVVGGSSNYILDQATNINSGTGEALGNVEATGFTPTTDTEIYALDVAISAGTLAGLASDINGAAPLGYGSVIASTSIANNPFPSEYNLFLTITSPASGADEFLGWDMRAVNDATNNGTVLEVAVVPEPVSIGLLALGGLGLLSRRRRRA